MIIKNELLMKLQQKREQTLLHPLEQSLREYAPQTCRKMSQKNLNEFLHRCYTNATKEGGQTYGEIKAFTIIAFHLGVTFYKDPLYPKIYAAFQEEQSFEMKLKRASKAFLKTYYPHTQEHIKGYKNFLEELSKLNYHTIQSIKDERSLVFYLNRLYPKRVQQVGGVEHLQQLFPHYQEQLKTYRINTPVGSFLFYLLLIVLGNSMIDDPRYHPLRVFWYRYAEDERSKTERFKTYLEKRLRKEIQHYTATGGRR